MRMLELEVEEFFVTHIGKVEKLAANCMRLTMCVQKGDVLIPRYACIWPIDNLLSRYDLIALIGPDILGEQTSH